VVAEGGLWIGESLMERLLVGIARLPEAAVAPPQKNGWHDKLTERELEVARAIAAGASNKEVARQLGITERTVKAHVGVIFAKLEVPDRLHLALRIRQLH
jgi:DNA-binding NarL/FixJ family response regulator